MDRPGAVQSALWLAQLAPKRSEAGYEKRELVTTLFGGLFTSRLNLNLREEHAYTYGAHAQNLATTHWGALYLSTSVRTDVTADALKEALKELERLIGATEQKGLTLVPLELYFRRGRVKLLIGLGRGKKQHDRREDIRKRESERDVAREVASRRRG